MNEPTTTSYYHEVTDSDGKIGTLCVNSVGFCYYPGGLSAKAGGDKVTRVKWNDVSGGIFEEMFLSHRIFHSNGHTYVYQMKDLHDFQRLKNDVTPLFEGRQVYPGLAAAKAPATTAPTEGSGVSRISKSGCTTRTSNKATSTLTSTGSNNNFTTTLVATPTNGPELSPNTAAATSTRTTTNNNTGNGTFSTTTSSVATNTGTNGANAANNSPMYTRQEVDDMFNMFERRLKEAEKQIGIEANFCLLPWRWIGKPGVARTDEEKGGRDGTFKLPKDVYSIMATWNWKSKPFWTSMVVVFGFQMLLMILVVIDRLSGADQENPLNLPVNVQKEVRIAQAIAVIVAVASQDDLRVGIEGFFQGLPGSFRGHQRFQRITKIQWYMAYMIRFLQGFMGMFTSFILLMQADTVIELLLNFLGVAFISDLDDRFFTLGALGYLGNANLRCAEEITRAEFYRDETKHPTGKRCSPSWFTKSMHVLGVFGVLIAMMGCFVYFTFEQMAGAYSVDSFLVEFGDQTVPSLGLFSGCYKTGDTWKKNIVMQSDDSGGKASAGRIVYSGVSKVGSKGRGGTFAFCSEMNRWTFYDRSIGDPCDDYILKSDITRTFDVTKAGNLQWYAKKEDQPLDFLKLAVTKKCDEKIRSRVNISDACEELELHVDGTLPEWRSRYYDMVVSVEETDPYDPALSHPIYVGNTSLEVVLFTGRRWVITKAAKLSPKARNISLTSTSEIENFFFRDRLFNVEDQDKNWISFISEEVTFINDAGTPLGLRWYYPRHAEDYNFSSADLSRPDDAIFACTTRKDVISACNDDSNPCMYGGTCQADGDCLCANGASGDLCGEKPLENGICDSFFNVDIHDFDGGDCCGSSCVGGFCGTTSGFSPFGIRNVFVNPDVFDHYESYNTSMGIIAASDYLKRYECHDPQMATFTVEISNLKGGNSQNKDKVSSIGCAFGSLSVRCDGKLHLQTPSLLFSENSHHCNQSHVERVHVPYGANCELTMVDPRDTVLYEFEYGVALYYGNDTDLTEIWENPLTGWPKQRRGGEVTWDVPKSKCLTDVLSNTTRREGITSPHPHFLQLSRTSRYKAFNPMLKGRAKNGTKLISQYCHRRSCEMPR